MWISIFMFLLGFFSVCIQNFSGSHFDLMLVPSSSVLGVLLDNEG